ncbi:MAG: hypothetical protein R3E79_59095 [Caldilineaceae bacterium]
MKHESQDAQNGPFLMLIGEEEDLVAEGDLVVGRYTLRGTHQDEFLAFPPPAIQSPSRISTSCALPMVKSSNIGATATTWA